MKNAKEHLNRAVSDEFKTIIFLWHHCFVSHSSCFETHSCFTKPAEYLVNDDEDDEKQTIGEALSTVNESPSYDVSRV